MPRRKKPKEQGRAYRKYNKTMPNRVKMLMELGATDRQAASALGIELKTYYTWKHTYPEFGAAANLSSEAHDLGVEKSLLQRAQGYTRKVQKAFVYKGEPVIIDIEEEVPPDVNAAARWLAARKSNTWSGMPDGEKEAAAIHEIKINVVTDTETETEQDET